MKSVLLPGFKAMLGVLLLLFSSTALAFTLIELPQGDVAASSTVTDSMTLNTQIQPLVSAIKSRIYDSRRNKNSNLTVQYGDLLAANSYVNSQSDLDYITVSNHVQNQAADDIQSLWLNSTFSSYDNDFFRTRFYGDTHLLLVGYDYTLSDTYIFGAALSYETTNIDTYFNGGNEQIDGFSITPYFAFLMSDTWSLDLSIGYGESDTDQYRTTIVTIPRVESNFSSTRNFVSMNLTSVSNRGRWYLTSSLGFLVANKKQDGYVESDTSVVAASDLDVKQWNVLGEAAYGHGDSESYLGLIYEKDTDLDEIKFTTGEQPANDDDSIVVTAGWRYYGKNITASFEFSSRQGLDEFSDNGISTTLRIDL